MRRAFAPPPRGVPASTDPVRAPSGSARSLIGVGPAPSTRACRRKDREQCGWTGGEQPSRGPSLPWRRWARQSPPPPNRSLTILPRQDAEHGDRATSPGGDYDLRARLIARHMSRHIPGEPTVKDPAFLAEAQKANVDISPSTAGGAEILRPHRQHAAGGDRRHQGDSGCEVEDQPFTSSNSTSKINVAFGGITPPAPRAP